MVLPDIEASSVVSACCQRVELRARNCVIWTWTLDFSRVVGVLRSELGPWFGAAWHQSSFSAAFSGDSGQVSLCS